MNTGEPMRFTLFFQSGFPSLRMVVSVLMVVLTLTSGIGGWARPSEDRSGDTHNAPHPQNRLPKAEIAINQTVFQVEIAATPAETQKGLMYRKSLSRHHGMLFLFRPAQPVRFWMKDILMPLDMVFISRWRVARVYHDVPPCRQVTCETYGSVEPVDMVMELPAGSVERDKIHPGALVAVRQSGRRAGKGPRLILDYVSGDRASGPSER